MLVVPAGTEVPAPTASPAPASATPTPAAGPTPSGRGGRRALRHHHVAVGGGLTPPLPALLAPYAVHVTLDTHALDTGANGQSVVLHPAGAVDLDAGQAAQLLVAHGVNESEAARLNRTAAVWTAVLAAGAQPPATTAPTVASTGSPAAAEGPPTTVTDQLAAIAHGRAAVRIVPVRPSWTPSPTPRARPPQADDAAMKLPRPNDARRHLTGQRQHPSQTERHRRPDPAGRRRRPAVRRCQRGDQSDAPSPSQATLIEYQDPATRPRPRPAFPSSVPHRPSRRDGGSTARCHDHRREGPRRLPSGRRRRHPPRPRPPTTGPRSDTS